MSTGAIVLPVFVRYEYEYRNPVFEFGLRWYGYRTSTRSLCWAVRVCAVSYLGCKSTSMGAALRAPRESVFAAV